CASCCGPAPAEPTGFPQWCRRRAARIVGRRPPRGARCMAFDAPGLTVPTPPSAWRAEACHGSGATAPGLDRALPGADPADVRFTLDPASVETRAPGGDAWNLRYALTGEMEVRGPDGTGARVPVRYEVSLRREDRKSTRLNS